MLALALNLGAHRNPNADPKPNPKQIIPTHEYNPAGAYQVLRLGLGLGLLEYCYC